MLIISIIKHHNHIYKYIKEANRAVAKKQNLYSLIVLPYAQIRIREIFFSLIRIWEKNPGSETLLVLGMEFMNSRLDL